MRPLTKTQAVSCEMAHEPTCKCRCGGALHGAGRVGDDGRNYADFSDLPMEDPHYRPAMSQKEVIKFLADVHRYISYCSYQQWSEAQNIVRKAQQEVRRNE